MSRGKNTAQDLLIGVLYEALGTEFGLEVAIISGNFQSARQRLYAARRASGDPALSVLQFRPGLNPETIWITKGSPNEPQEPSSEDEGAYLA